MSSKGISKIIFYITAMLVIALTIKVFSYRIDNFTNYATVYGLKRISPGEIKTAIDFFELKNKYFYQINPHELTRYLSKRPLVKKIKIRTTLYPKIKYSIYLMEHSPWAVYRSQILNQEAISIIKSKNDAKLYKSKVVEDIYANSKNLITIKSYKLLDNKKLLTLKKISDQIQDNLDKLGDKEQVREIIVDKDRNLFFYTDSLTFKFGVFDGKVLAKAKKLDSLFNKMKSLSSELDYIDLSLNSNEILLGRKPSASLQ